MTVLIERKKRRRRKEESSDCCRHCEDITQAHRQTTDPLNKASQPMVMIAVPHVDHDRQQEAELRLKPPSRSNIPTDALVRMSSTSSIVQRPSKRQLRHSLSSAIRNSFTGRLLATTTRSSTGSIPSSLLTLLSLFSFAFTASLLNLILLQPQLVTANASNMLVGQQQSQSASSISGQQQQHSVIQMPTNTIVATTSGKARYKTMYACEDRQLTMDCDYGSKINLIRANFGRFSITQCNEQGQLDLSTDCMSPITFRIMQERCQDRQKCSVNATSMIFGDRCPKTRKYLEVHFQCQPDSRIAFNNVTDAPDRVDLRVSSQSPAAPSIYPQLNSVGASSSSILPPNNPSPGQHSVFSGPPRQAPAGYPDELRPTSINSPPNSMSQFPQQPTTVINSEIMSHNQADNNDLNKLPDQIVVTMRHTHIENVSNPRCFLWDQTAKQWTEKGGQIVETNMTHTVCAFDQATSYLLVMDYSPPSSMVLRQNLNPNLPQQPSIAMPPPSLPDPLSDILDNPPVQPTSSSVASSVNQPGQTLQQPAKITNSFSPLSYLLAIIFIAVVLTTIAFVISSMRSSAGATLKSLGNFTAFSGPKYKAGHRRQDGGGPPTLHSKDLLVINNQNGHQFIYAPASTTKISSSSSTHILSAGNPTGMSGQHQGTLHQLQQQQIYSGNGGTLSNLSGTGAQSNNYYYGLMGLTSLFQHQQQQQPQHHFSQHHLNQQVPQSSASYNHQANKSTISNESANSSSSSSGVESGSTSMQQHQQQPQTQQACLVTMNNDFNLMGHHLTANYGHLQQQQQHNLFNSNQTGNFVQQPTVTLNAHYSTSGGSPLMNPTAATQQQVHNRQLSGALREHIYECVDDDKPYMARLLMPMNNEQQFGTLGHQADQRQQQLQQLAGARTMTLSSRLLQDALQHQSDNSSNKRLFPQPAIVRDSQAGKTNIVCSKLAQVTPQRATEISGKTFQHDVMAIYNGNSATSATSASNSNGCYGRLDLANTVVGNGKLSTDC